MRALALYVLLSLSAPIVSYRILSYLIFILSLSCLSALLAHNSLMAWGVCGGLSCVWYWLDEEEKSHPEKYAKTHTEETVSDEKSPETLDKARRDKTRHKIETI